MTTSDAPAFDPLATIAVLNSHGVRYVVIGGIAAGVQGAMWATTDLDIVYARDRSDLLRLAEALTELEARLVDLPPGARVRLDAAALGAGDIWTLMTRHGRLDLLGEPAQGLRYEVLADRARIVRGRQTYLVASIDDLIMMKRAAGRPKDLAQVDLLEATAEELDRLGAEERPPDL